MKTNILIFIVINLIMNFAKADLFGGDLPILAQIAVSTAKELKATLELLNVADQTQKNITDANRQISLHMETMDRINRLAERAEKISKMKARNLSEFNSDLRKIKYSVKDAKNLEKEFEKKYGKTAEAKDKINDSINTPEVDKRTIDKRLSITEQTNTPAGHSQNTAYNTALTNQILYESSQNQNYMMREQLDYFNEQRARNYELDRRMYEEKRFLNR